MSMKCTGEKCPLRGMLSELRGEVRSCTVHNCPNRTVPVSMSKTDFHINVRPVSIDFTCPHCEQEQVIPWNYLSVPEYWGDDWGEVSCPLCGKSVALGDYDYD